MSAPMTREQRTQRLADLRARMAARHVILSGGPLMSLPLHRRVAFAISDPGAITPRGNDYQEPLHVWQARAVAFVLPEAAEVDRLRAEVVRWRERTEEAETSEAQLKGRVRGLRARVAELEAQPSRAVTLREASEFVASMTYSRYSEGAKTTLLEASQMLADNAAEAEGSAPVEDPHDSPLHHSYALGRDLPKVEPEQPAVTAERWNAQHPVGTPVYAYPGCRPEDDPKCTRLTTRTRSAASVLGGHTAVVWVEGHSPCIALTHIDPRPEGGAL